VAESLGLGMRNMRTQWPLGREDIRFGARMSQRVTDFCYELKEMLTKKLTWECALLVTLALGCGKRFL
jgi:hypothetical protein